MQVDLDWACWTKLVYWVKPVMCPGDSNRFHRRGNSYKTGQDRYPPGSSFSNKDLMYSWLLMAITINRYHLSSTTIEHNEDKQCKSWKKFQSIYCTECYMKSFPVCFIGSELPSWSLDFGGASIVIEWRSQCWDTVGTIGLGTAGVCRVGDWRAGIGRVRGNRSAVSNGGHNTCTVGHREVKRTSSR